MHAGYGYIAGNWQGTTTPYLDPFLVLANIKNEEKMSHSMESQETC